MQKLGNNGVKIRKHIQNYDGLFCALHKNFYRFGKMPLTMQVYTQEHTVHLLVVNILISGKQGE
jgi:hypothetical protein